MHSLRVQPFLLNPGGKRLWQDVWCSVLYQLQRPYKRVLLFEDDTNRKATVCNKIDVNFSFCSFLSTGEGPEKVSCGSYCGCRNTWRQRRAKLALQWEVIHLLSLKCRPKWKNSTLKTEKVKPKRFYLNDHSAGFCPQTHKKEPPNKTISFNLGGTALTVLNKQWSLVDALLTFAWFCGYLRAEHLRWSFFYSSFKKRDVNFRKNFCECYWLQEKNCQWLIGASPVTIPKTTSRMPYLSCLICYPVIL